MEGGRQQGRGLSLAVVPLIGLRRLGGHRAQKLTGTAARGAPGNKRSVSARGRTGCAREFDAFEGESAPQRGDDDVVRDVLGFMGNPTVPS